MRFFADADRDDSVGFDHVLTQHGWFSFNFKDTIQRIRMQRVSPKRYGYFVISFVEQRYLVGIVIDADLFIRFLKCFSFLISVVVVRLDLVFGFVPV